MRMPFVVVVVALLCVGCGGAATDAMTAYVAQDSTSVADGQSSADVAATFAAASPSENTQQLSDAAVALPLLNPRKVIHRTTLTLTVTEFGRLDDEVAGFTAQHGGYITTATVRRNKGVARTGHWDVRVPVENYRVFMKDVCALGVPISRNETAEDVNDQYVDLAARVRNEQAIEERIRELLKESDPTPQQIKEFEARLNQSRQAVEQLQGQLNVLGNKSAFAYVSIDAREELEFVPSAAPTESDRISVAWANAFGSFKDLGTDLIVWLVKASPWMVVLTPLVVLSWFVLRWIARRLVRASSNAAME